MASLVESGVKNLKGGDADSVGFFQMRVGIWDNGPLQGLPHATRSCRRSGSSTTRSPSRSSALAAGKSVHRPGSSASGSPTSSAPPRSTAAGTSCASPRRAISCAEPGGDGRAARRRAVGRVPSPRRRHRRRRRRHRRRRSARGAGSARARARARSSAPAREPASLPPSGAGALGEGVLGAGAGVEPRTAPASASLLLLRRSTSVRAAWPTGHDAGDRGRRELDRASCRRPRCAFAPPSVAEPPVALPMPNATANAASTATAA